MKKISILLFLIVMTAAAAFAQSDALSSEAPKTATDESMELFRQGSEAFVANDVKSAIPVLERALELQKKKQTMERTSWITLIDDLSMSYSMTGDIDSSRAVIEYGISKEPTYPLFYYNNACGYAVKNDEDNAIKNLRLAFKYKKNMLGKQVLPDPAKDDSFAELMKSQKFLVALVEMKSAK